ncbi:hypothetical protein [Clostridium folliculivorans]|uniref:Uncharacterized protein n=1 Tax=Clostridium folliculivorans TaxID=2886038 RepID=A0A9W5Y042_9CLOT|nr:hypothetical protein [Clostridium folliculivorans]GKU24163.1 hypothetical protein CFOLD11_09890 [Clostridium folliculivorans]GKU30268.1 hypothetical protein CFB3_23750 [Clostridium folliculivorans]
MRNRFLKTIGGMLLVCMLVIPVIGNKSFPTHGGVTTMGGDYHQGGE